MRPTKFSLLEIELDRADAADAVLAENTGLVCDFGTNGQSSLDGDSIIIESV